ncbi:MAG: hypothetical protein KDJ87_00230 [Rhizobiaceae bacterium]|nr:hypothetical protein [Rhizobiaceae bacterium]
MLTRCLAIAIGLVAAAPMAHAGEFRLPDSTDYCATPNVIKRLKEKVDHKFRGYTRTKLFLVDIIDPVETHARDRDDTHTVGRKWCHAKARMNDGTVRDMWYLIEKPWGFAGMPMLTSAEFCIVGLDPWKVYGKDCSTIRNNIGW